MSALATRDACPVLRRLLKVARANNQSNGITGLLLYHEGNFMQILEGPKDAVNATFGRINKDRAHKHVTCVISGPVNDRIFGDWSMAIQTAEAFSEPDSDVLRNLASVRAEIENAETVDKRVTLLVNRFLASFRDVDAGDWATERFNARCQKGRDWRGP